MQGEVSQKYSAFQAYFRNRKDLNFPAKGSRPPAKNACEIASAGACLINWASWVGLIRILNVFLVRRHPQLRQSTGFDLPHPFLRHTHFLAHLFEGERLLLVIE